MNQLSESQQNSKNAMKAGVWYTISNIATRAVLIFTTPIYTRLLSTTDYGIAATFTSWYSLLTVFCSLNLSYSIGRAKIDYRDNLDGYVGSMQLLSAIFTSIFIGIALAFSNILMPVMELNRNLMICLAIYLFFYSAIDFRQALYKYRYNYKGNILISAFITILTVIFTFIFIFVFNDARYYGRVLGVVCPVVLLGLLFWYQGIKNSCLHINFDYWKYGLSIALPLLLNTVSLQIMAQSDRIMITKFVGSDKTAVYTLAYQYAVLINIILDSIGRAWLPWFHDTFESKKFTQIRDNVKPLIAFGCVIGIGCISLAPEAILILGGEPYKEGQWVVAPLVLGIICRYIFVQFEHIELHLKKTTYTAFGTVIAACINLILNYIFIPKFGFAAAAYTTLFSYYVLMLIHHFVTVYKMHLRLYDMRYMYLSFAITVVCAFWLQTVYSNLLVRIIFDIIICVLFAVRYKDVIINIFNTKRNG